MGPARYRTAVLLAVAVLPLAACGPDGAQRADGAAGGSSAAASSTTAGTPTSAAAPTTRAGASSSTPGEQPPTGAAASVARQVDTALADLGRAQQIAQLFLVGVPLDDVHRGDDLAARGAGGIFLAGRSKISADDLATVTAGWQAAAGPTGLWIAVDQEGGEVQTLSGPGFGALPSAQHQGRLPAADLGRLADGMGAALHRAGVNLDLAPVVDVVPAGTEQQNPPVGVYGRQYGATAPEVAAAAEVVVDGLAAHGVTATLKHFPGLGRVHENTDTAERVVDDRTGPGDPEVKVFGEVAEQADAPPFVMTSSAVYTGIDDTQPAGWSDVVVERLLRERLGFDGVVISDDVGAAAAVQAVPPGERAVRCLSAGGTMVLTVDPTLFPEMLAAVVQRDRTDEAFRAQVDAAVRTALAAKAAAGLLAG